MLDVLAATYFLIGAGCLVSPAVQVYISERVEASRGHPLLADVTRRARTSAGERYARRLLVTVSVAVLWPLHGYCHVRAIARERARDKEPQEAFDLSARDDTASEVTFSYMGGAGSIRCVDCGFGQRIISFTHGYTESGERCCNVGRQCLTCGRFVSIYGEGEPARFASTKCECGGQTSRDHVLFCPQCRSKNLSYWPGVIT